MQAQISAEHPPSTNRHQLISVDDDTLLTSNQTRARVGGVSNMCIWRWMRDDRVQFPHPIQINRRNYWKLGDLRRWQSEQSEKRAD